MRRIIIIVGIIITLIGIFWPWLSKIPLGHLPGDIIINRPNARIYIPITTMILLSLLLTLILRIFHK
ncbi:MAG TPA: DUF2905 domain-containing protein [Candidatus Marinimicrobia bacterium]|nr:DUF2905 domain-containing protein [Candidatus Neomarinimicrobiota bacterium]